MKTMSDREASSNFSIDLVVKVGGSCLTYKTGREQSCDDGLNRLAQLAAAIEAGWADTIVDCDNDDDLKNDGDGARRRRRFRWVLLHGAGSFGHPHAAEARLTDGSVRRLAELAPEELRRRRLGFCDTRRAVLDLSGRVAKHLIGAGVPVVPLSPCSHYNTADDVAASHWPGGLTNQTRDLLLSGFVPALHGDAVLALDTEAAGSARADNIGWTVLGGDVLAAQLAGSFRLRRAVFVTSTGGVFSEDPATAPQGTARLLPEVRLDNGCGGIEGVGGTAPGVADVTGGMRGKLAAAARMLTVSPGTEVRVCGWDSVLPACLGEPGSWGTRLVSGRRQ